jgi:hypothetical protein
MSVSSFRVLLRPMVIAPDTYMFGASPFIADEGSIVQLAGVASLYRNFMSPVTRDANEILVHYWHKKRAHLGWLSQHAVLSMKPIAGPLFLVTTRTTDTLTAWDCLRLLIARNDQRAQKKGGSWSLAAWLGAHASNHVSEIKRAIREFGGRVKKSHDVQTLSSILASLILKTEIQIMATTSKKTAKTSPKRAAKKLAFKSSKTEKEVTKKSKKASKNSDREFPRLGHKYDEHIIRIKNASPFREGTAKEKEFKVLKKGMTVEKFVEKGGKRGQLNYYRRNGWIGLKRPAGASSDDE